jgi:hypothetical protein
LLVHHGPVADVSRELAGVVPGGRFQWENLVVNWEKEGSTGKLTTATNSGVVTRFDRAARSNCGGGMNSSAKRYGSEGAELTCGMEAVGNRGALGCFILEGAANRAVGDERRQWPVRGSFNPFGYRVEERGGKMVRRQLDGERGGEMTTLRLGFSAHRGGTAHGGGDAGGSFIVRKGIKDTQAGWAVLPDGLEHLMGHHDQLGRGRRLESWWFLDNTLLRIKSVTLKIRHR